MKDFRVEWAAGVSISILVGLVVLGELDSLFLGVAVASIGGLLTGLTWPRR